VEQLFPAVLVEDADGQEQVGVRCRRRYPQLRRERPGNLRLGSERLGERGDLFLAKARLSDPELMRIIQADLRG
jgi:hypothetical protein